jgi:hypothetical protein
MKTLPGAEATERQVKMIAQRHGPFLPRETGVGDTAILAKAGGKASATVPENGY